MKQELLLKQFEYSIFPSKLVLIANNTKQVHNCSENIPLAQVKLDFEKGSFSLAGDWHFIMASNEHCEQSWFACHKERIKVETSIYPCQAIDLADEKNDGLIFALDGTLTDGDNLGFCSGLLVFDNVKAINGKMTNEWNFTFYIYDADNDDCEIRLKLPLHTITADQQFN